MLTTGKPRMPKTKGLCSYWGHGPEENPTESQEEVRVVTHSFLLLLPIHPQSFSTRQVGRTRLESRVLSRGHGIQRHSWQAGFMFWLFHMPHMSSIFLQGMRIAFTVPRPAPRFTLQSTLAFSGTSALLPCNPSAVPLLWALTLAYSS